MRLKKTVLEAEGVNLSFSGVKILHDIHFDLAEGEVHCLLGENGAGKSSFIKILGGIYHADSGKITIDKANYIPIYMYKGSSSKLKRMKILDIEKSISDYETGTDTSIGQATYIDLKKQLEKIKNIVGNEIN